MWRIGLVAPWHVGSSWTRDRTREPVSPALAGGFLTAAPPRKSLNFLKEQIPAISVLHFLSTPQPSPPGRPPSLLFSLNDPYLWHAPLLSIPATSSLTSYTGLCDSLLTYLQVTFFFFGHTMLHAGSYFPDQGLNLYPLH